MNRSDKPKATPSHSPEKRAASVAKGAKTVVSAESIDTTVALLWREVLSLPRIGLDDNFFEIGGTSLLATVLLSKIIRAFQREIPITAVFEYPTVRAMSSFLKGDSAPEETVAFSSRPAKTTPSSAIAIIGMTGRFPGAKSVEEFWTNLCAGTESITFFKPEELSAHERRQSEEVPGYIAARPILEDIDKFDAELFNVYPKEAAQMDPQHRVFLECAWEVLERAGYDPTNVKQSTGVFAGCSMNTYFMRNLVTGREFLEDFTGAYQVDNYVTMLGNDKDFLPTRVSYKLNLHGPSINVQSACSTSLVAVAQACQSLLTQGCDMALAGAVSITFPQQRGYVPQEGGLASLDGHCRPFDSKASGTVFGHGAAVLLLKRLEDAIHDSDQILGVIRGFALNNDGSAKVGYTAPSIEGQAQVIARAQKMAGVPADSISYLEAHGTGTPLGDPVEVAALNKAFRAATSSTGFCALGTAKANVGHLDVAAGGIGLIKTVLQIQNRTIPKLLHFEQPNPHLDLSNSPFYIPQSQQPWKANGYPLRAGVSAFGVGGTNAHVIVEEPPQVEPSGNGHEHQLIVWSARTPEVLASLTDNLAQYFAKHPNLNFADAAYTLQTGRSRHKHRRAIVASSAEDAAKALSDATKQDRHFENPDVVFCFPGQGVQFVGMGRKLYETEPVFRQHLNHCDAILMPLLGESLLSVLYPENAIDEAQARLNQTLYAQPAIFAFEYALAQLWLSWGIQPAAMVGHSIGEYVAACLSDVFSLEDALQLVSARCHLMQDLPRGSMLAVRKDEQTVAGLISGDLDLAAVNGPQLCVVSGPDAAIDAFAAKLDEQKISHRKLATSHAFHSKMVEPALASFAEAVRKIEFHAPVIPYVSTLTGNSVTAEEVAQPDYWTRQLRHTVRFAGAIRELSKTPERIFLEVGPAETLVQLMRQTIGTGSSAPAVLASLPSTRDGVAEDKAILQALGSLWALGASPDWQTFHTGYSRRRVLLPTYPFERKRHWVEQPQQQAFQTTPETQLPAVISAVIAPPNSSVEAEPVSTPATITQDATMLAEVKNLLADLSGMDMTEAESDASFLELGFDSLFLTQLTQALQGKYQVKLTFRQIMESFPTLGTLASHLEANVAPALRTPAAVVVATPAQQTVQTQVPAAIQAIPGDQAGSYASLFASQLRAVTGLISQQLEILRGQSASVPAVVTIPATQPISVTPSATNTVSSSTTVETRPAKPAFTPFKPLQRGESGGLNPLQEDYVQNLTRSYNARTKTSKQYTQQHRSVFADGRVVSGFNAQIKELVYPIVVDRAKGAYLWDKDGNRYIDILNGYGAILYGHSPDFIVEAVQKQMELGFAIGPQTELAGECAELIRELTGMERVTFCNTGSEAVMGAMRLARTVTGRNLVVVFSGDYHGSFDEVLVKSVGNQRTMPAAPGIPRESVSNMLVLDYGTPEALEIIRKRANEIAAVLVEPVQSRHPELRPVEFLREIRSITEQSGSALIFDEVVTGFRTHIGGMQAVYGIRADLATYGKVVAGGLPVGILAGSATYMDALDGGQWQYGDDSFPEVGVTFYAGTFMRHPLAMAAVRASLQHIKDSGHGLQNNLAAKTSSLVGDLNKLLSEYGYPSQIETFSSWFYFAVPTEPRLARLLHYHLREQGIHIQEGFPCFLTTAHTDADLEYVREAFRNGLAQMQKGQALPQLAATSTPAPAPMTKPAAVAKDIPITEQQREILLGSQLGDEANCAFNESTSLSIKGNLDIEALRSSFERFIARHEALRSTIDGNGDTIHIAATLPFSLEAEDLGSLTAIERETQHATLLSHEASTPFDLQKGPLFRTHLIRLAPQDHVLIFTAHHIIFDGWSTNVLFTELSEIYNATVNKSQPLLAAPLTFSQYALEQNKHLNTPERAAVEKHWLDQYKIVPSPLQLPIDHPRPALRTNEGATKRFTIAGDTLKAIRKAGARQGSTLFTTLLGAYALLMHRLSQQDDVVIGIPMAGQSKLENGSTLVGHCVNFLPIRSTLQEGQTVAQFLKQTNKSLLDAYDHQDYTYGTLLHKLKVPRDPSRLQLVEVQFNVEQVGAGLKFHGLDVDLSANPKKHVNMDLFFNFVDRGNELWLDCDYNTGLFDATTIDRWFGHLESILASFIQNAEQPAAQVSLLTASQTAQLLDTWNNTATDYPHEQSIHRVFEQQVTQTPSSIAITSSNGSLTYFELNEKANQLARFLQRSGVTPGANVAICLERSLESIVALLGILKAGAGYVPVDPSYPASRIAFLVSDAGAKILLSQRSIAANLPKLDTNVICLDMDWPAIATELGTNLSGDGKASDLAYVMYTSGSTGNPKGVLVPHRAVLRLVKNSAFASFSPDEVFLQLAPLSFDAATFEIWGALLNGGKLVLAPAGRITPEDIGQILASEKITTLWLTAALFHLVATEHIEVLRPLRQLLAGGDVLSVTHVRRVLEELPHLRLINGYGPTENTTFTCCHSITLDSLTSGTVPIGRPIANTRIYIVDVNKTPVPVGVAGELYAAGDGLSLGYLNAAELAEQKFIEHTFENGKIERLYRTGDLARYRADGIVEFLGRADTQVKIRGYRIELAEIEHVLESSPLVRSAVVAVRTDWTTAHDAPGDKRLAAYIIPAQTGDSSALVTELRKHLQQQLPEYMQPAAIMLLDSFPRTINGKVDRHALPAPQPEQLMRERVIISPRNDQEDKLAGIWSKVLDIQQISINDSIFELGGDSLLIFRISTLANQAGLRLTARHIFQYRTIANICAQLHEEKQDSTTVEKTGTIQAIPRSLHRRPKTLVQ